MPLKVGDIVTVVHKHYIYSDKQGEVVEIKDDGDEDGNIGVKFGRWYRHLFDYSDGDNNSVTVRFLEGELRKDANWGLEVKVLQRFGENCWHSVYVLDKPFDPTKRCKTEGCNIVNARRCLINIWGNVYEIDLCEECAREYDGKCGESFPAKILLVPAHV